MTLLTTSFTLQLKESPDYLKTGEFFEDIIGEYFDLEIEKHPDYQDAWVFSISYPVNESRLFAKRIREFCLN